MSKGVSGFASGHQVQEVADALTGLEYVLEALPAVDLVLVTTAVLGDLKHLVVDQFRQDALDRTLGDADFLGDVADAGGRVAGEDDQDVGVVGQKGPRRCCRLGFRFIRHKIRVLSCV